MRKAGYTLQQIADKLEITRSSAFKLIDRALQVWRDEIARDADHIRATEMARLDALLAAVWPAAVGGDTTAVGAALRVMERRARMLGLDKPIKIAALVRQAPEEMVARATVDASANDLAGLTDADLTARYRMLIAETDREDAEDAHPALPAPSLEPPATH